MLYLTPDVPPKPSAYPSPTGVIRLGAAATSSLNSSLLITICMGSGSALFLSSLPRLPALSVAGGPPAAALHCSAAPRAVLQY